MKRLIVNADDLGLTPGVNRAILEAHRDGIVTSATLMANGPAFDEAMSMATGAPNLALGCHVDLIQLTPILPPDKVRTLTGGEQFRPGFTRFAATAMRGRISAAEMEAEASAQMRKLQSAGVKLSHFDTHKHTHVVPPVLKALLRAARDCGVAAVRNPFEPESIVGLRRVMQQWALFSRWAAVQSLRTLAVNFRREVERAGMVTTDGTVGIALTGHMDQRTISELLAHVDHGTFELVAHPGYSDPALAKLSRLTDSREEELRWLTSAETRKAIERNGIKLISYADIAP